MPQRGNIAYDLIQTAARQGAGPKFTMYNGSSAPVSGHVGVFDAGGSLIDGGPLSGAYVLPPATTTTLGGVIAGANVSIAADGTISVAPPGGAPAGPADAVQFNNSGAFGGSSNLLWDNTGCTLNIASPPGLGNQGPGISITDPDNSRSAQIYVNQVGLQIDAGSNTAMYLYCPNHGIQISAGGEVLLESSATVGPAFQFETNASASSLIILPNGYVGINQPSPQYQLGVVGDVNITGQYRINGTPLAMGQNQTPWLSDIQAANFNLHNAQGIGVAGSANNLNGITIWGNYQTAGVLHSNSNSAGFAGFEAMGNVGGVAIGAYGSTAPNGAGTAIVASVNSIPLAFLTAAVERMRITGGGNVGIGTSSPTDVLDVNGQTRLRSYVETGLWAGLQCNLYYDGSNWRFRQAGPAFSIWSQPSLPFVLTIAADGAAGGSTGLQNVIIISDSGNVGLGGTTSPQYALDVNGQIQSSGGIAALLTQDQTNQTGGFPWAIYSTGAVLRVNAPGLGDVLSITDSGSVGIGTTSPNNVLDVANGNISVDNGSVQIHGSGCSYAFDDRAGSGSQPTWVWYAQSGVARLWNTANADCLSLQYGHLWIGGGAGPNSMDLQAYMSGNWGVTQWNANVFWNGSAFQRRNTAYPGLSVGASVLNNGTADSGFGVNYFSLGGTMVPLFGAQMYQNAAFVTLYAGPDTRIDSQLQNPGQWYTIAPSNTQLIFRMRGSDGVFRQGTVNLA